MADERKDIEHDADANIKLDSPTAARPAILDDPAMDGLTLYEKKALLVNRELDAHGMGKYQWYIFFLCGFGYLLDLLYAQAFGLIEPAIQQEFGFGGTVERDGTAWLSVLTMAQMKSPATSSLPSPPA